MPYQALISTPGTPASASVGTFGSCGLRLAAVTASGRILVVADLPDHRWQGVEAQLHLAADEVDQGRSAALVGHMRDVDPGCVLEHLGRDVLRAAGAAGREVELARLLPGELHQRRHRVDRQCVADDQHVGHRTDEGHRDQVAVVVVAELEEVRRDRMGGDDPHHHGVAVGGLGGGVGGQGVGNARPVLDHHRPLQQRAQAGRPPARAMAS